MKRKLVTITRVSGPSSGHNNETVYAHGSELGVEVDTHGGLEVQKNRYTAPVGGLYSVTVNTFNSDTGMHHTETHIRQVSAGDFIEVDLSTQFKVGDWLIKRSATQGDYLLEVLEIYDDHFKAAVIEGPIPEEISRPKLFKERFLTRVPKGITLDTYKLLYDKT